jgi:catechol 2,3-dioxygenase-like lactoylglutathione lyase family enzyme
MNPEKEQDRPDPVEFGRGIAPGLGINLLVSSVDRAAQFQARVFGARIEYWEEHFAIMSAVGSTWLLHSDWSYRNHEMMSAVTGLQARGGGVELRLYGIDPDKAEAAARLSGATVLATAADKPHGMREVYIVDDDGYVWVPCRPTPSNSSA